MDTKISVTNVNPGQGSLTQRLVFFSHTKGILVDAGVNGDLIWSKDPAAKVLDSAITFTENFAKNMVSEIRDEVKDVETRTVFTMRNDFRATKDNCADAGLPRW